jgi:2'-5' RNA ligase
MTTIGVAIAIPEPWGSQLQSYRTSLGDSTAGGIPTHITLLPPVDLEPPALSAVERHLRSVSSRTRPFTIHLRGTGTFRPVSPVVFVVVVQGISGCEQLASAVRCEPLASPLQFPYHPHVTVAHHLDDHLLDQAFEELARFECEFTASSFSLYVHDRDVGWQVSRDFPLDSPRSEDQG